MTKHYAGSKITVATTITNAGVRTDPSTVTFTWRMNHNGSDNTATVTNTSTGVYEADVIPDKPGILYGKWGTTGSPLIFKAVRIPIHNAQGFL